MDIEITTATARDAAGWHRLWSAYLAYYGVDLAPEVTARTWARTLDPASPLTGRLAWQGAKMVGFAMHHHHASTWVMGDDCYLEDLFVDETARGAGVGRALIDDLITIARAKGWHRLYWHTDEGNTRARTLYDSYIENDGHIRYRLRL
ncbi:MAG: GNAT family N-acetyltransferase [Paracoccaceae bacterium]